MVVGRAAADSSGGAAPVWGSAVPVLLRRVVQRSLELGARVSDLLRVGDQVLDRRSCGGRGGVSGRSRDVGQVGGASVERVAEGLALLLQLIWDLESLESLDRGLTARLELSEGSGELGIGLAARAGDGRPDRVAKA